MVKTPRGHAWRVGEFEGLENRIMFQPSADLQADAEATHPIVIGSGMSEPADDKVLTPRLLPRPEQPADAAGEGSIDVIISKLPSSGVGVVVEYEDSHSG